MIIQCFRIWTYTERELGEYGRDTVEKRWRKGEKMIIRRKNEHV